MNAGSGPAERARESAETWAPGGAATRAPGGAETIAISIVVPTVGRECLRDLARDIARERAGDAGRASGVGPAGDAIPERRDTTGIELIIVDDRRRASDPLAVACELRLRTCGRGPAAARNAGWRAAAGEWIAFLDDDVRLPAGWLSALRRDIAMADAGAAAVQARLTVPAPPGPPDDWQRQTLGLARAEAITADMVMRRAALRAAGGFDERFPRAYREDVELAHRLRRAGWCLERGQRRSVHPVRPESRWVSLRSQRGNADDALLRRMYGRGWRQMLGVASGRRHAHAMVTACGAAGLAAALAAGLGGARGTGRAGGGAARALRATAALGLAGWGAGVAEFAVHRVRRAPGSLRAPVSLAATSVAIPPLAVGHWLAGWWRHRGARPIGAAPGSTPPGIMPDPATALEAATR